MRWEYAHIMRAIAAALRRVQLSALEGETLFVARKVRAAAFFFFFCFFFFFFSTGK